MMDGNQRRATYVVAVSGGVDSMVLLDMLHKHNQKLEQPHQLIIAHFDHGIRPDSGTDRILIQDVAAKHRSPFVYGEGKLGAGVSEAVARQARYDFLHKVRRVGQAESIITAHHQDDLLETAIINMIRGTGRRGLTSLSNRPNIHRPLLNIPKSQLISYAKANDIVWHEDATNQDTKYLRNYVRHNILPKFSAAERQKLLSIISNLQQVNAQLDQEIASSLDTQSASGKIDRLWFNHLPHKVSGEVMASWLRAAGIYDFDKQTIERLVVAGKVAKPDSLINVSNGVNMKVDSKYLALEGPER